MIAAPSAVQKNSSIVRWLVSASVISSRRALTRIENSPSVKSVSGSVRMRRTVPMITLTIPKSAETQMYAHTPPETSMPDRSHAVTANARASTAQRINRNLNTSTTIQRKHGTNRRLPRRASDSRAEPCSDGHSLRATADSTDSASLTLRKALGLIVALQRCSRWVRPCSSG